MRWAVYRSSVYVGRSEEGHVEEQLLGTHRPGIERNCFLYSRAASGRLICWIHPICREFKLRTIQFCNWLNAVPTVSGAWHSNADSCTILFRRRSTFLYGPDRGIRISYIRASTTKTGSI